MSAEVLSAELIAVIGLTALAVVMLMAELAPPALVALGLMGVLLVSGIVTPAEGFAGLADSATITVAAMFVLSAGLQHTGAVERLGNSLSALLERHQRLGFLALLVGAAVASGFVNNTAVVAVMIPIVIGAARRAEMSPSQLLLPLSFASMLGGVCTLMGTSTNLLVSSIVEESDRAPLSFFEMLPLGAVFVALGLAYLWLVRRWLPKHRGEDDLTSSFEMAEYLTRARLTESAGMAGLSFGDTRLGKEDMDVVALMRDDEAIRVAPDTKLRPDDELRIRGRRDTVRELAAEEGLALGLADVSDLELEDEGMMLVEVVVSSNSAIAGRPLGEIDLWSRFTATPLALRRFDRTEHEDLADKPLSAGDVLLLLVPRDRKRELSRARDLLVISGESLQPDDPRKMPLAVAIIAVVVGLAAFGVLPVVVGAPVGAVAMVALRCIELDDAYQAIDWDVVFLLAGMLALGKAFAATGADGLMSTLLVRSYDAAPADVAGYVLVGGLYLVTLVLTSTMSNQATAALLTPIALSASDSLEVSARPLVMAVAFAASSSFLTPVGYQTNTMVYGAGHYRFSDFVRIGGPLSLLLSVVAAALIPAIWPL